MKAMGPMSQPSAFCSITHQQVFCNHKAPPRWRLPLPKLLLHTLSQTPTKHNSALVQETSSQCWMAKRDPKHHQATKPLNPGIAGTGTRRTWSMLKRWLWEPRSQPALLGAVPTPNKHSLCCNRSRFPAEVVVSCTAAPSHHPPAALQNTLDS